MASIDESLKEILTLNGAMAASVFDWASGMTLGMANNSTFDIELASAGNAEVVKAKMATMKSLRLLGKIEDILITLSDQIHILTIVPAHPELCVYIALDSTKANLALARIKLQSVAKTLVF
jgi:hypothetical protein